MDEKQTEGSRSKSWCFTLNNYVEKDFSFMSSIILEENIKKLVYQEEISSSGTPHFQGAIMFDTDKSFYQMKELHPRWNIRTCKEGVINPKTGKKYQGWLSYVKYCQKLESKKPNGKCFRFGLNKYETINNTEESIELTREDINNHMLKMALERLKANPIPFNDNLLL